MDGRARGICTHGERPSEEAGNSRTGNHCFGWFHGLTFFLCMVDMAASAPELSGRRLNNSISDLCARRRSYCQDPECTSAWLA